MAAGRAAWPWRHGSPDGWRAACGWTGVHDHDVARCQCRDQELLDPFGKTYAVYRLIEHARGIDPVAAQGGNERHSPPVAIALWRAAVALWGPSRSKARPSHSGSRSNSVRRSSQAISSSWIISPATKSPPSGDPGQRRAPPVPAALQPRPQPDRAGLHKAQTPAAQGCRAHSRSHVAAHRLLARRFPTTRMRKLPQKLRVWCNLMSSNSNG